MSALQVRYCDCDPGVVPGVPGQPCRHCHAIRIVWASREQALRLRDEVATLRRAARIIEVLLNEDETVGEVSDLRALAAIGDAQIQIGQATRGLTAAYETFQHFIDHEVGAASVGADRRPDQDPGRSQ